MTPKVANAQAKFARDGGAASEIVGIDADDVASSRGLFRTASFAYAQAVRARSRGPNSLLSGRAAAARAANKGS